MAASASLLPIVRGRCEALRHFFHLAMQSVFGKATRIVSNVTVAPPRPALGPALTLDLAGMAALMAENAAPIMARFMRGR